MTTLSLTDIHKSFFDTVIIHGVDLKVVSGEFPMFVCPSGCGKSTLLHMIASLEPVTGGTVRIGGKEVTRIEPSNRGVTMVFQSYALYLYMSVYDNLSFVLRMNGVDKELIGKKVRKATDILGLHDLLERKLKALGGPHQATKRLATSRSIVRELKISSPCPTWTPNCAYRCTS